jgi:hypothetical protein
MQCTASAAIVRMASLSSCLVPVPVNSVGESSPRCHDFPFRHYSHQTVFFRLHTESPKRAATVQPCDKYTIRQVLLSPGGPRGEGFLLRAATWPRGLPQPRLPPANLLQACPIAFFLSPSARVRTRRGKHTAIPTRRRRTRERQWQCSRPDCWSKTLCSQA